MKKTAWMAVLAAVMMAVLTLFAVKVPVKAAEDGGPGMLIATNEPGGPGAVQEADNTTGTKAIAAAIVVGLAAAAGALAMGLAVAKSNESMARQPEAASQINSSMMLGMVFIETAIIYALIVAILIIFVL